MLLIVAKEAKLGSDKVMIYTKSDFERVRPDQGSLKFGNTRPFAFRQMVRDTAIVNGFNEFLDDQQAFAKFGLFNAQNFENLEDYLAFSKPSSISVFLDGDFDMFEKVSSSSRDSGLFLDYILTYKVSLVC